METTTRIHTDLAKEHFDLGWFPEYLPEDSPRRPEACLEVRVGDLQDDDREYDRAVGVMRDVFGAITEAASGTLVGIEHRPEVRSRVRSYKGLLRRNGFEHATEVEMPVSGDLTLIWGHAVLGPDCRAAGLRVMLDRSCWFALLHSAEAGLPESLADPGAWCKVSTVARVDYMRLIPLAASEGLGVVSTGLDTRGEFVNLRVFDSRAECAHLASLVATLQLPS